MTEVIDELGPVDYFVVEFRGNKFNGDIAPALGDLTDRKRVKVLDSLAMRRRIIFVTRRAAPVIGTP